MAYLESEYAKSLEEFKHKELREALEKARKQWTAEELSHREEIVKVKKKELYWFYVGISLMISTCCTLYHKKCNRKC